jgi:K+-transporting ATPase A subunit
MTLIGWVQIILYCAVVVALVKPLGGYMTRVFNGERTFLSPVLRPVEAALYWAGGVNEKREQHWLTYTVAMLLFHVGGFLILYALMRLQAALPFNPAEQSAVAEDLSFNTAMSFITNTNWQNYGGESTMSYLVQMLGFTHQNFLSAASSRLRSFAASPAHRPIPSEISGSISPAARSTSSFRSAFLTHSSSFGRASHRRWVPMSMRRPSKAPSKRSR